MDGVLLIDKPKGITSTKVVEKVRKKLRLRAGHTGTLDPIATGLLVILTGRATRFSWIFQGLDKGYLTSGLLGVETDTYDIEGKEIQRREVRVTCDRLAELLREFRGDLLQNPPPYSAKKVQGKRAYKLARKGISPELKPVRVKVHELNLVECRIPRFEIYALVSSGTYMRTLIHDIGRALGTGAVMTGLRRVSVGPFSVKDAVPFGEFLELEDPRSLITPVDRALSFLPEVSLDAFQGDRIMKGNSVLLESDAPEGRVRIYIDEVFVGVGELRSGVLKPLRLLPQLSPSP
jgi:tRNA pseudouridine55 synthase